jgi:SAM-dependent methyltransferase
VTIAADKNERESAALRALSGSLLGSVGKQAFRGPMLSIYHQSAPVASAPRFSAAAEAGRLALTLTQADALTSAVRNDHVVCTTGALPFQSGVFSTVALHHVVQTGAEPELEEACRVLAADGLLVILGLNRLGFRFLSKGGLHGLPGLAPLKVKRALDGFGMAMQGFAGAGLLGRRAPLVMSTGWRAVGAPVADLIVLLAAHGNVPGATRLEFRKPRSGVVQSAHEF